MTDGVERALREKLGQLRQEHRDIDTAILALERDGRPNDLQIKRLKKKKLGLKDQILQIEGKLLPDIIA